MLPSPFLKCSQASERKLTWVLLLWLIALMVALHFFDAYLKNNVCKNGIVSFELAKNVEVSTAILHSWNAQANSAAGLNLGLDFLFLIIYPTFLALLIHKLNERLWVKHSFHTVGVVLIWASFVMGLSDAIENMALVTLLLGNLQQQWSSIAYYFALLKFAILAIGILYIVINSIILLSKKGRNYV